MYCQSYESWKILKDYSIKQNDLRFSEEIKTAFKVDGELTRKYKEVNYFTKQLKIGKKTLQKLSKENNTNIKFGNC
jgi:hypothetical protein